MLHKGNKLNQDVKRATLLDIPEEIVRYISGYLMMKDVLHLSMTCKMLHHMLPKYSFECKKTDIEIDIGYRPNWSYRLYFDSPPFTSHIFMATISGKILVDEQMENDDVYLNDGKLYISIQLMRPQHGSEESIVIARHQTSKLLYKHPYRTESMVLFLTMEDPIINMIQPGDYFRFIKLHVKIMDFMVQTRGIRFRPKITAQKGDINALMQDSSERLHTKKGAFDDIIEKFKEQDKREAFKKLNKNFVMNKKDILVL